MRKLFYISIFFTFIIKSMAQEGACLYFDGIDDQVIVASNNALNVNNGTIEAWIKTNNAGSSYRP